MLNHQTRVWFSVPLVFSFVSLASCRSFDLEDQQDGAFASCCEGLGTCVPRGAVKEGERTRLTTDSCEPSLLCVPSELVVRGPLRPTACTVSATGAEGRCLPPCLPEVAARQGLSQDDCKEGALCAPCFDPVTGEATGACALGTDKGPTQPPVLFASCCGEQGRCVPDSLISDQDEPRLSRSECAVAEHCVPTTLALDSAWRAPSCTDANTGGEGRCLLSCLPEVESRASKLTHASCAAGTLCAPCFDPTTGAQTGACDLGGDPGPANPAHLFAQCCEGAGLCVPSALVPADDMGRLSRDSCASADEMCVPQALAKDEAASPERCIATAFHAEGRCLPACLPDVAKRANHLQQDSCVAGELCAPCFDPVHGDSTGACELGGDTGPEQPPALLAQCCGGLGRCVSATLVPSGDRKHVAKESCQGQDELCVPEGLAESDSYVAPTCVVSSTGLEGRCLPACLPEIAARAWQLTPDGCAAGNLCAPCFDPLHGRNTGACNLGGDPGPTSLPTVFDPCCGALGRCVPSSFVVERDRNRLGHDVCGDSADLCLPEMLVRDADYVFSKCAALGTDAEGRCLPSCLPEVAARAPQLGQQGCPSAHLCTPCTDPLTGKSTGACELGGDSGPTEEPSTLPSCCGDLGRCVPSELVPADDRGHLGRDSCTRSSALCVPAPLAADSSYVFPLCTVSTTGAEGRCLPSCLPEVSARASQLRQDGCAAGHLCSPCFDPIDGSSTGACALGGDHGPTRPATVFSACCGDIGLCVPRSLVPSDDQGHLERDGCALGGDLCVPRALAKNPDYAFPTCVVGRTGAEGRCLPACLPEVAARAQDLSQDGCAGSYLCTPCYDPLDGSNTGACNIGGDSGPQRPPYVYPHCCSDQGRCIPRAQVPAESQSHLDASDCSGTSAPLCVPLTMAKNQKAVPPTCHDSATHAEGRCLMQCLPEVRPRAERLRQSGCGNAELCVPCYDPTNGEATGACSFSPNDPGPTEPPVVFAACCGGLGLCVPRDAMPGGTSLLPAQSCSPSTEVCAPRRIVADPNAHLPSCASQYGPSVCVDLCFVDATLATYLPVSTCAESQRCVPCWTAAGLCQ